MYTYCAMRWCNFFVSIFFVNAQQAEKKKEIKNAGTRTTVKKWCQNLSRDNKPKKSFKMQHSTHQHFDQDFFFHISYLLLALALKNYFLLLRQFNLQSGTQKCLGIYNFYWTLKLGLQNSSSTSQRLLWMENYVLNEQKKSLKLLLSFFFKFLL